MNRKVLILAILCGIFVCANATGNIGSVLSPIIGVKTGIIEAVQKAVNAKYDAKLKALNSLSGLGGGGLSSGNGGSLFGGLSGSNSGSSSGSSSGNILGGGGVNPLALVHSVIRSFTSRLGGSSSSGNSESMSLDFGNDDSFTGDGSSTYDASSNGLSSSSGGFESSGGYDTNQYSSSASQGGTQFSADTGYNYPAPQPIPQPIPYQPPTPTNNGYNYPSPQPIPQPIPNGNGGGSWSGGNSGGLTSGGNGHNGGGSSGSISSGGNGHEGSSGGLGGLQNILGGFRQIPVQILTAKKGFINNSIDKKIAHFQKSSGGAGY